MKFPRAMRQLPLVGRFFRSVSPTPDDVREFWKVMCDRYSTKRVDKSDSMEMRWIAQALGLMGIVDQRDFLQRFTTVIDSTIYTPFVPGVPTPAWSLWGQVRVCVHEHVHVFQDRASGGLGFKWNYLTSAASRAHYEAEAYRTDMVLEWRYQGRMTDPLSLASNLKSYGCSDVDVEVVRRMLALSIPSIREGAMTHEVCRWACDWLDQRWER
jgi:hypothetical protein